VATVTKESNQRLRRGTYGLPAGLGQATLLLRYQQTLSFILLCHPNLLCKKLLSVGKGYKWFIYIWGSGNTKCRLVIAENSRVQTI